MKLLAILAIAVLAASHLSAQTETVLKAKATDALTESIVIPSGKSVTIASGATITAASGSTVTGFGGTPAWGDITGTPANVTEFGELANAAGVLTNNGSGTFSYTGTSAGGNAGSDFGKIPLYNFSGHLVATALSAQPASAGYPRTAVVNTGLSYTHQAFLTTTLGFVTPSTSRALLFPDETGTLISTGGTGTVTNTMLAGSIALSKLSITGTPTGSLFLRDDGTWAAASTDLASPGPIGGTTPSTGAFTTTTATSVVTADVPGLAITQEWNNAAVSFSALKISATNTASVSPATFPSAFLRMFVNGSEVGGFYNYYNSLSLRCQNVEMGGRSKNHGISRQSDLMWNITAADTYVAAIDSDEIRLSSLSDLTWKGDFAPYSGSPDTRIKRTAAAALKVGDATTGYGIIEDLYRRVGGGSPEGAITAPVGCIYHRTDTGDIWRKTSGTGNTGWVTP